MEGRKRAARVICALAICIAARKRFSYVTKHRLLRLPVMTYPHEPYVADWDFGNLLWVETQEDMQNKFGELAHANVDQQHLRAGSKKYAKELLDYRVLTSPRLYQ